MNAVWNNEHNNEAWNIFQAHGAGYYKELSITATFSYKINSIF